MDKLIKAVLYVFGLTNKSPLIVQVKGLASTF